MMPRRPTETESGVPLWLIPQVVFQWIQKAGEELDWIRVRRTNHHFYLISVRTRPVKREFGRRAAMAIPHPAAGPKAGAV